MEPRSPDLPRAVRPLTGPVSLTLTREYKLTAEAKPEATARYKDDRGYLLAFSRTIYPNFVDHRDRTTWRREAL
jgi:hypothetical protein